MVGQGQKRIHKNKCLGNQDAKAPTARSRFYCSLGALRKGPPFHGSRSLREMKIQNASCQMGGREVTGR